MDDIISMSYGNGGLKTSELLDEIIVPAFSNPELEKLSDGAILNTNGEIAYSTDSFVIYPYFFLGGDIGKLSVCGTVNDLVMCGSIPKYLSLGLIIEEGFKISDLKRIVNSIKKTAELCNVKVVTGDTKVVDKGHGHGIYINTSGIGQKINGVNFSKENIKKGDKVIMTGSMGDHGISILCEREGFLESQISSDCTPLYKLTNIVKKYKNDIRIMRDPTRGGVATVLCEFADKMNFSIELDEGSIYIDKKVKSACAMLGIDPLYSANEGKAVIICKDEISDKLLSDLRNIDEFKNSSIIGEVIDSIPSKVFLRNELGSTRILDKLSFDILPRIC